MSSARNELWVYMEGSTPVAVFQDRRSAVNRITKGIPLTPNEVRTANSILERPLQAGFKFQIVGTVRDGETEAIKDRQIVLVEDNDEPRPK